MQKYLLPILFLLIIQITSLQAQQKPTPIGITPDAPEWMQLMLLDNPNVAQIQAKYNEYYDNRPFEKNSYTQYYKRWMHWARAYTQADGSIYIPTPEENQVTENQALALRNTGAVDRGSSAANWTFVGPKSTWDTDGTTEVTWQTNIYSFDISPSDANILYAGGETGGLWKTTDKGLNWTLLTKNVLHNSFGAVKIHPTDPNTVYAGTSGKIIKTTDGGQTWTTVRTETDLWTNEIVISKLDPNIVLAATKQGLLRTTNGGTTWTKLFTNEVWSIQSKPNDGNTIFLLRDNGSGSDFMRSTDGGENFTNTASGWWSPLPNQEVEGALLATCPSNPNKIYAYLSGYSGNLEGYVGVFVSNNNGETWANTNPNNLIGNVPTPYSIPNHTNLMDASGTVWFSQGYYDMAIVVNPNNENELFAGGCSWWKSTDGGATWAGNGGYAGGLDWAHPDIQGLAASGSELWIASDGGLNYSTDFGASIEARMNGISGSDMWGFDSGWNEDILVGGRYHNGNMGWYEQFPEGKFYRLGGAEASTGFVNPGPERKVYHSDIGGKRIKGAFTAGVSDFAVSAFPNESYAYYANSEMEWHPNCWNIVFMGKDNKLWKSTDGGTSYAVLHTFPGASDKNVYEIEISRQNPDVMYCSQWDGTDDKIWRSLNAGATWTACTALPLPNNNDRVKLAVSDANPNTLWAAVTYGSNGKKIYKSTNSGTTWTNLTTNLLNNTTVSNVMAQYGTDDGVYIGTKKGVFYRNNSHTDWQPFADGLPISAEALKLKPFYKTGKIRNGTFGYGVWETDLFEPSTPKAVAMADKLISNCQRDTFYFDDHSAVLHAGASWAWTMPDATWTSDLNNRQPKAVFANPGTYSVIMALTSAGVTTFDTLQITAGTGCSLDSLPGKAVTLGGNTNAGSVIVPALYFESNTFTVTAWVKPNGIQPDYSAIFMSDGDEAAGFNFKNGTNEIGYHWPGGAWSWNSGLFAPAGKWSHIALAITPTSATIYVNGVASKHANQTLAPVNFNSTLQLGSYRGWGDRYVKGTMDEVCIYNKTLTQSDIREIMHLTRTHTNTDGLVAYYQFNEADGLSLDRVGTSHASLGGSASRINSTVAVGPGASKRLPINAGGQADFGQETNFLATFPNAGTLPNGEICVTRINLAPDKSPAADSISRAYWAVHNYGTNQNFANLTSLQLSQIGSVPPTTLASQYQLFHRPATADGATWMLLGNANTIEQGGDGSAIFTDNNNIGSFGQFIVSRPRDTSTMVSIEEIKEGKEASFVKISPNPVGKDGLVTILTNLEGECKFRLFDEKGRAIRVLKFSKNGTIDVSGLDSVAYFYQVEGVSYMVSGVLVVVK
jgi:photosystem II stability/assembly factor-like uncharacterized protein